MNHFPRSGPAPAGLLVIFLTLWPGAEYAAPYPIERIVGLDLHARPIVLRGDTALDLAPLTLSLPPAGPARARLRLPAGLPASAPPVVAVEAEGAPGEEGGIHRVTLRSRFERADGVPVRSERAIEIRDGTTAFFEAAHGPGWRLTLALTAERVERPVVRPPSGSLAPIVFRVEVGRVVGGEFVPVETNELSTFLGQPVEYSFRLGHDDSLEHLRLVLTPRRTEGDLAEVGMSLSGTLSAGRPTPLTLDRDDTLWTDRGTTTEVSATDGDPPDGFRFRVTPLW